MANQQGFSATEGVGELAHLLAHYDRTKLYDKHGNLRVPKYPNLTQRGAEKAVNVSEIDVSRTWLNYNLAPSREGGQAAFIERRLSEIYCHKSALKNAIVDWVITLPVMDQYENREAEFFKTCYEYMAERYGEQNVVSAYVHMDEQQPHMHFVFLPVAPDLKHAQGFKLSRKAVNTCQQIDKKTLEPVFKNGKPVINTASFSLDLHLKLNAYVEEKMGVDEGGIRLTAEQLEKRTIKENLGSARAVREAQLLADRAEQQAHKAEAKAADAEQRAEAAETRLESVRRAETAGGAELVSAAADRGIAEEHRAAAAEDQNLGARAAELERQVQEARERAGVLERANQRLRAGLRGAVARLRRAFSRLLAAVPYLGIKEGQELKIVLDEEPPTAAERAMRDYINVEPWTIDSLPTDVGLDQEAKVWRPGETRWGRQMLPTGVDARTGLTDEEAAERADARIAAGRARMAEKRACPPSRLGGEAAAAADTLAANVAEWDQIMTAFGFAVMPARDGSRVVGDPQEGGRPFAWNPHPAGAFGDGGAVGRLANRTAREARARIGKLGRSAAISQVSECVTAMAEEKAPEDLERFSKRAIRPEAVAFARRIGAWDYWRPAAEQKTARAERHRKRLREIDFRISMRAMTGEKLEDWEQARLTPKALEEWKAARKRRLSTPPASSSSSGWQGGSSASAPSRGRSR